MDIKSEIKLFCCSAVEDEPFREKLQKHLQILQKYGLINSLWSSQDITPGKVVDQETRRHVNTSQMILLLVSPDFLSSEVCYKIAIQAMERQKKGVHVIPIILRPVYWKDAPFGKLKVLPTNENPITSWANEDAALFDVAAGIRQTIVDWTRETSSNILIKMENVVPNALTASSFALVRTLVEHLGPVASVAFSSDGQLLLSDSWDNTIKIWNQDARSVLYTLKGHAGPAYSVGLAQICVP